MGFPRAVDDTHGRWPWVAAAALVPVTALAARRPAWLPLAALLAHQTEEWFWPGGFLPWFNREIMRSPWDEEPIDRRIGLAINVPFGWGFSVAAAAGPRAAGPAALLYVSHLGNMGLHVSWAVRNRRYDPGTVTALLTLTPVAVRGLHALRRDPTASDRAIRLGMAGGAAMSAGLPVLLRRRLRRRIAERGRG